MHRSTFAGAAVVMLAAASPAAALPSGFKAKADALLAAAYAADGPGASVAISEGGRIVYQGQRGLADVAAKRPITAATVFRIGSITKQFSSAVVLQLAAEHKLKLDDRLSKYLPTYPNAAGITVRELLNHTSGIQSYTSIPGWMVEAKTNKAYTTDQLIAEFKDMPAPSKPGETWNYNNSGYILVGALIEAVTKRPWYEEVDRRIAQPLGLRTLRYGGDEASIEAMAAGYTHAEAAAYPLAQKIHMSVPGAAGALVADAADIARWGHALHHAKVVAAPYYAQMTTPTKLPDGTTVPYGYGLETGTMRGDPTIGHSGGIFGFSSDSIYVPAKDVFVTVLTNSDDPQTSPGGVMRRLAAMAIGDPYPAFTEQPTDAAAVKAMLGTYKFKDATRILSLEQGKLYMQRVGRPRSEVFAVGDNRYYYGKSELDWFAMAPGASGKWTMQRHANGEDAVELGTWSGPVPVEAAAYQVPATLLASYAGSYSTPIGAAKVAQVGDALTIQLSGQPPFPLKATGPAEFTIDAVAAKVRFVSTGGKVSGIGIEQGGKTLPGTRD